MKYCTECGKSINMTDKFCSHCGAASVNNDISIQSDSDKPIKAEVDDASKQKTQEDKINNANIKVYLDDDGIPFVSKDDLEKHNVDAELPLNLENHKVKKDTNNKFTITIIAIIVFILFIFIMYVNSMRGPYGDALRTSKEFSRDMELILREIEEHKNN